MVNSLQHLEAELKREITKQHKLFVGKGPGSTSVRVVQNCLYICLMDALSATEVSLKELPNGEERIREFRYGLINNNIDYLVSFINSYIKCSLKDFTMAIDMFEGIIYILLIFDEDLEVIIENKCK